MTLRGGEVSDWVPLLTGTLQLQGDGLPSVQQHGWHLMGVRPEASLRVFALLPVSRAELLNAPRHGRSSALQMCIRSLLEQTVRLEGVLLGVPGRARRYGKAIAGSVPFMPSWFHSWRRRYPKVQVLQTARRGLGAALLAAVVHIRDQAAWILAVDAAHSYHPLLCETLLRFGAGSPGCAVATHGWMQTTANTDSVHIERGLRESLYEGDVAVGPVLQSALGLLLQRGMLNGFEIPEPNSLCGQDDDLWLSAHLAHRRLRRAFLGEPAFARALGMRQYRRQTDAESIDVACTSALSRSVGGTLWRPLPRIVLCVPCPPPGLLQELVRLAVADGSISLLHAAYACRDSTCRAIFRHLPPRSSSIGTRLHDFMQTVQCSTSEPPEHGVLREALLAEREASTVMLLPPANLLDLEPTVQLQQLRLGVESLVACSLGEFGRGFCEQDGWTAVNVGTLACFNSNDAGIRKIYGCAGEEAHPSRQSSGVQSLQLQPRAGVWQQHISMAWRLRRRRLERAARTSCPSVRLLHPGGASAAAYQACVLGKTYGCAAGGQGMWVRRHCSGIFRVDGSPTWCGKSESFCMRGLLPEPTAHCGLMLLTTYFTTRRDWQRDKFTKIDFSQVWPLYESILQLGLSATVAYDKLPGYILRRYACARFKFLQVNLNEFDNRYGVNDVRFFVFQNVVQAHPEWRTVFLIDAFDIQVRANPCPWIRPGVLYVGSEQEELKSNRNPWMLLRFHDLGGRYNDWYRSIVHANKLTFNCGIIGGFRDIVLRFLAQMVLILADPSLAVRKRHDHEINVDMAVMNFILHEEFGFGDVVTGQPVHSLYKEFQNERRDVWFVHK